MNPFDFINSISHTKENLMDEGCAESEYNPYLVNRGLSYFPDTIHYANLMNQHNKLTKRMQYDFLLNIISKKKRYGKWNKNQVTEQMELVSEYYNIPLHKTEEYLSILTEAQLNIIKQRLSKGGRANERKGK
jgi:hypothetical protein